MSNKIYKVLLTRYPEEFEISASSEAEAIKDAKKEATFSVWESEAEIKEAHK
jgi:hypothetical protein